VSPTEKKPIVVIACQVLQDLLEQLLPPGLAGQVTFLDYGLHRLPGKMTITLQQAIDDIARPSVVMLGYGLCGNGLNGLKAGRHTLLAPRVDDCIAILLGSRQAYLRQFHAVPGTYYLSKGWLESGSHPLKEYHEYKEKYGQDDAEWLMDEQYRNYERIMLVVHSQLDLETYRPEAQQVAEYCGRWGMRYEEITGSDAYVRRLIEVATDLTQADNDFVVVPPGGTLQQGQFIG
jgi:hypothetical protein